MKVIHSSLFRAVCAIIVGGLLIQYREQTVTWITIAIGILFFLSGVISLLTYLSAKRNSEKMKGQYLYDAQGNHIVGMRPNFPLVGMGSLILGLILALMPNVFSIYLVADVHPFGIADYGSAQSDGESGFGCQNGKSGNRVLADAYVAPAARSPCPLPS